MRAYSTERRGYSNRLLYELGRAFEDGEDIETLEDDLYETSIGKDRHGPEAARIQRLISKQPITIYRERSRFIEQNKRDMLYDNRVRTPAELASIRFLIQALYYEQQDEVDTFEESFLTGSEIFNAYLHSKEFSAFYQRAVAKIPKIADYEIRGYEDFQNYAAGHMFEDMAHKVLLRTIHAPLVLLDSDRSFYLTKAITEALDLDVVEKETIFGRKYLGCNPHVYTPDSYTLIETDGRVVIDGIGEYSCANDISRFDGKYEKFFLMRKILDPLFTEGASIFTTIVPEGQSAVPALRQRVQMPFNRSELRKFVRFVFGEYRQETGGSFESMPTLDELWHTNITTAPPLAR